MTSMATRHAGHQSAALLLFILLVAAATTGVSVVDAAHTCPWFLHNVTAFRSWGEMTTCEAYVDELLAKHHSIPAPTPTATQAPFPTSANGTYAPGERAVCFESCRRHVQYTESGAYSECRSNPDISSEFREIAGELVVYRYNFVVLCERQTPPESCPDHLRNQSAYDAWKVNRTCDQPKVGTDFCDICTKRCYSSIRETSQHEYQTCLDFVGNVSDLGQITIELLDTVISCNDRCQLDASSPPSGDGGDGTVSLAAGATPIGLPLLLMMLAVLLL